MEGVVDQAGQERSTHAKTGAISVPVCTFFLHEHVPHHDHRVHQRGTSHVRFTTCQIRIASGGTSLELTISRRCRAADHRGAQNDGTKHLPTFSCFQPTTGLKTAFNNGSDAMPTPTRTEKAAYRTLAQEYRRTTRLSYEMSTTSFSRCGDKNRLINSEPISYATAAQSRQFLVATPAGTAWRRRFTANAVFVAAVFEATDEA